VGSNGVILDPQEITISVTSDNKYSPKLAFNGSNYIVVWGNWVFSTGSRDVLGVRVSPQGIVLDANPIKVAANGRQGAPAVAAVGGDYFVVWQDARNDPNGPDIYGSLVSTAGVVKHPSGFAVGKGTSPDVASNGTDYLVVWSSSAGIRGKRVSQTGIVLDPNELAISDGIFPAVASDGRDYLVVWQSGEMIHLTTSATRVTSEGRVLDLQGIKVSQQDAYREPAVASNGKEYWVAWAYFKNLLSDPVDIRGARVSTDGVVRDPLAMLLSSGSNSQVNPAVASNGTNSLVVWEDTRNGSTGRDIYGVRIAFPGIV
jgi:hypothetical protein